MRTLKFKKTAEKELFKHSKLTKFCFVMDITLVCNRFCFCDSAFDDKFIDTNTSILKKSGHRTYVL